MFKKLLQIGMLASAMMLAFGANAQEETKTARPDFPRVGFWSNWSLGGEASLAYQTFASKDEGNGKGVGLNLMAQKQLNWGWTYRLSMGFPLAFDAFHREGGKSFSGEIIPGNRYFRLTTGVEYSLLNACRFNPERRADLYLLGEVGAAFNTAYTPQDATVKEDPYIGILAEAGMGFSVKVCKHSKLYTEARVSRIGDVSLGNFPKGILSPRKVGHMNMNIALGYLYNFGLTKADEEILAQKAMLTQENFDALNEQINQLQQEVITSKNNEKKLQNQVEDLERQLAERPVVKGDNGRADSLAKVIDDMKGDQLNSYALPFSITYGVNEYQVSEDQYGKLQAIAAYMKSNEAKFKVVGFCDKTGSDAYNMKLSEKRANEVKRLLVKKYGIAEDRLSVEAKGKSAPFGDAKFDVNRRVSVYRAM